MTQTRSGKKPRCSNVESEPSSKHPRKLVQPSKSPDIAISSTAFGTPSQNLDKYHHVVSPSHVKAGSPKKVSKSILREQICDLELLNRIGMVSMFQTMGCESLLSPPRDVYPKLVSEFYKNLVVIEDVNVSLMVKSRPLVFHSNGFAQMIGVSDSGPCPQIISCLLLFPVYIMKNGRKPFLVKILCTCLLSL